MCNVCLLFEHLKVTLTPNFINDDNLLIYIYYLRIIISIHLSYLYLPQDIDGNVPSAEADKSLDETTVKDTEESNTHSENRFTQVGPWPCVLQKV